jgi:hypothetical protein
MDEEDLDPREVARMHRRDHDAAAAERDLLRPGMGKVFKQILDRQGREARESRETDGSPGRRLDPRRGR